MLNRSIQFLFSIVIVTTLCVSLYVWRDQFSQGLQLVSFKIDSILHPPCSRPIGYRLGDFNNKFNLSQTEFISVLQEAEKIWEDPMGRDLFSYQAQGSLVVNLIYDNRQQATDERKSIDDSLDRSRASYEVIKQRYQERLAEYQKQKTQFERAVADYETKREAYEKQVGSINKRGGASESEYNRLENDRKELNQTVTVLRAQQEELKQKSEAINALTEDLNTRARELNLAVDAYNEVGSDIGEEFDEGLYRVDASGENIDVFQFDNRQQLLRLLAHEFGHALGIEHVADPEAIMYHLNQSSTLTLAPGDLEALKTICHSQ